MAFGRWVMTLLNSIILTVSCIIPFRLRSRRSRQRFRHRHRSPSPVTVTADVAVLTEIVIDIDNDSPSPPTPTPPPTTPPPTPPVHPPLHAAPGSPPSPNWMWSQWWILCIMIVVLVGFLPSVSASGNFLEQVVFDLDGGTVYVSLLSENPGCRLLTEKKVQTELLLVFENQLLEKENSGCRALLKDDKVDDLSRMYKLYSKVPKGLDHIGSIFKQHITDEGTALVQQAEDAALSKAENAGSSHEQVLKGAFEVFLNKGVAGSSSAELLATFCDNILKKGGSEKLSDEAIEDSLEKVVKLLAYVSDKDLFAEFYRKKLSQRLLFDKSVKDDHERSILTKLKQQCGGQFTSKMEGMVTDLTLARENQTHFEEYLGQNPDTSPGLDLTVTVLTTGFWPSYKSSDLNIPDEMVKRLEVFKQFYQTKTKHRKLTWVYSLGSCNISGKFGQKTTELIVGTYQAAALMLFNASDRLSYSEIATQLNLADEDLVRVLQSLSCAKYKILIKDPSSRTVTTTDHFSFNSNFTDRMRRIRIPLPPVDERKKVVEDVDKDRRYAIDGSIVRIMKSRKVLGYQQLITECVEQLSRMFKPDFKEIKKRIEDLITRDYIEQDKENPQLFRYLA